MSRMSGSVRSRYFIDRIRFGVEKTYFCFFGFREGVKSIPPPGGGIVYSGYEPGGQIFARLFWGDARFFQKSSFPDPKSYSDVRKHIPDTSRRSRRVQNTILISKTYFLDKKSYFGFSSPNTDFPQTPGS